jgi:hypothetical protein
MTPGRAGGLQTRLALSRGKTPRVRTPPGAARSRTHTPAARLTERTPARATRREPAQRVERTPVQVHENLRAQSLGRSARRTPPGRVDPTANPPRPDAERVVPPVTARSRRQSRLRARRDERLELPRWLDSARAGAAAARLVKPLRRVTRSQWGRRRRGVRRGGGARGLWLRNVPALPQADDELRPGVGRKAGGHPTAGTARTALRLRRGSPDELRGR